MAPISSKSSRKIQIGRNGINTTPRPGDLFFQQQTAVGLLKSSPLAVKIEEKAKLVVGGRRKSALTRLNCANQEDIDLEKLLAGHDSALAAGFGCFVLICRGKCKDCGRNRRFVVARSVFAVVSRKNKICEGIDRQIAAEKEKRAMHLKN